MFEFKEINKELEERIEKLFKIEPVRFCDLKKNNLQAIAFFEKYDSWIDKLFIYNDPLEIGKDWYYSINPNKHEKVTATKIFTLDLVYIVKERDTDVGFLGDLFGRKGKTYYRYGFARYREEANTRVLLKEDKVKPIFEGDPNFLSILEAIKKKEEENG